MEGDEGEGGDEMNLIVTPTCPVMYADQVVIIHGWIINGIING